MPEEAVESWQLVGEPEVEPESPGVVDAPEWSQPVRVGARLEEGSAADLAEFDAQLEDVVLPDWVRKKARLLVSRKTELSGEERLARCVRSGRAASVWLEGGAFPVVSVPAGLRACFFVIYIEGEFCLGAGHPERLAGSVGWLFASQSERSAFLFGAGIGEPGQPCV